MNAQDLSAAMRRLLDEGGSRNRLVIQQGHAWMVAQGSRGGTLVSVDAAASHYLPPDRKLDAERTNQLRSRGFAPNPPQRCLRREYPQSELRRAAHEVLALLRGLYAAEGEVSLLEQLGEPDGTTNVRLVEAMKTTAKERDQKARFELYRALLASTVLVPMVSGELRVLEDLSGFDVFGCFSDQEMAERFDPRGVEVVSMRGRTLVHRLMERKVGSLLINPGGTTRGELYRNEIESLASSLSLARTARDD